MALYFIRHGQTDWNLEQRLQSRRDVPLNAHGLAQARQMKRLLHARTTAFTACYCSSLQRARDTAGIVTGGLPLALTVEPSLVEIDLGEYEGCLESELRARRDIAYDAWCETRFRVAAPGGESLEQARRRVRAVLRRAAARALHEEVLIVAHQGVNMAMKAELSGRADDASLDQFRQANDEADVWCAERKSFLERLCPGR